MIQQRRIRNYLPKAGFTIIATAYVAYRYLLLALISDRIRLYVNFLVSVGNWASGTDNYGLISYNNLPLSDGTPVQYINWQLDDPTGTVLSSDVLPLTAPDLSKWQSWFGLSISTDRNFGISATITSATPEPATAFLFGLGIILARKKLRR